MLIHACDGRMQLHKGDLLKLKGARGARLTTISGTAWITVERDARDIVILPDDSFIVPSDGSVFVGPLSGTVTLDLQGARDAGSGVLAHRCGPIAKIWALVGLQSRLGDGVA